MSDLSDTGAKSRTKVGGLESTPPSVTNGSLEQECS